MNQINIIFDDNSHILFKLVQNDFVEEWIEEFKKILTVPASLIPNAPRVNLSGKHKLSLFYSDTEVLTEIRDLVTKFKNELGIVLPIDLKTIGRHELNKLHRFFTSMIADATSYDETMSRLFKIPDKKEPLYTDMCSQLNDLVHCAEQQLYANSSKMSKFDHTYGLLNFEKKILKPIKRKHWKYLSTGHTVSINSNILGKSYFNAYYDDDCPLHKDIMNEEKYCCDLEFEFKKPDVFDMLRDKDFLSWLRSYNINPSPLHYGRMPVGDILEHTVNVDKYYLKVNKIEYA